MASRGQPVSHSPQPKQRVISILGLSMVTSNFMAPYWQSSALTFSANGRITRGWQPVLENYRKRYPDREAMGHLTFTDLEVSKLGDEAALVLGRWKLERTEPIGGAFTLVWRRIGGRWLIVHDHTSRDAP